MKSNEVGTPPELAGPLPDPRLKTTISLRQQAHGHANRSDSAFTLIERGSDYRQDFSELYFPPEAGASLDDIEDFCTGIMGSYFAKLRSDLAEEIQAVVDVKKAAASGRRLFVLTNHGNLVDVAMVMATTLCEIGDPKLIQKSRIMVGPIMKELDVQGQSAIKALQKSSGVFVGFPDSDSTKKRVESGDFDAELVESTNRLMLRELISQARKDQIKLLVAAGSGSTDEATEDLVTMKPISSATESIAGRYFDDLVPVAIAMGPEGVGLKIGTLQQVHGGISLHEIMEQQLAPMYKELVGKKVVYQRPQFNF